MAGVLVNPEEIRIKIPVGDETVILILDNPTPDEISAFLKNRFKTGRGNKIQDQSNESRIKFIDDHLIDIENAVYRDLEDRDEGGKARVKPLNKDVKGWKPLVNTTWKISAAMTFEDTSAETDLGNG